MGGDARDNVGRRSYSRHRHVGDTEGATGVQTIFSSLAPQLTTLTLPVWLDMAAVVVGGMGGALNSCERKLDLVGALGLALICGLGGGLIRDTIMQVGDVYMLKSAFAIPAALITGGVVFFFHGLFARVPHLIEWVDIISVGLFAASGADKAIVYELTPLAAILMGMLTGVGGGLLRDVFLGDVPHIFRRGNLYALCAIAGATVYYLMAVPLMLSKPLAAFLCLAVTVGLRRMSLRYNIMSPADIDLSPKLIDGARRAARKHGTWTAEQRDLYERRREERRLHVTRRPPKDKRPHD